LSWATSNPFSKKPCAAQEAIHDHFRFFASLRGSFFALPASVSLNGLSGETNLLGNILASIQKSRWFFGNLARKSQESENSFNLALIRTPRGRQREKLLRKNRRMREVTSPHSSLSQHLE
jgi:hypothetical protein